MYPKEINQSDIIFHVFLELIKCILSRINWYYLFNKVGYGFVLSFETIF